MVIDTGITFGALTFVNALHACPCLWVTHQRRFTTTSVLAWTSRTAIGNTTLAFTALFIFIALDACVALRVAKQTISTLRVLETGKLCPPIHHDIAVPLHIRYQTIPLHIRYETLACIELCVQCLHTGRRRTRACPKR
jgi:hypothetical protein